MIEHRLHAGPRRGCRTGALLAMAGATVVLACGSAATMGGAAGEIDAPGAPPDLLHPAFVYPGGARKAYVISMDDGNDTDRMMVGILNRYGLRATFHLNSGLLGGPVTWFNEQYGARLRYVTAEEIPILYRGHEVSSHSVSHPNFTGMGLDAVLEQVTADRDRLEEITGSPVVGIAYPFGSTGEFGVEAARRAGHIYGRLAGSSGQTTPPVDPYQWAPTANPPGALSATREYLDAEPDALTVFLFMGHSYEYVIPGADNDWRTFEALCRAVSAATDVWSATMAEYIEYRDALLAANASLVDERGVNGSEVPVWVSSAAGPAPVPPGTAFAL